MAASYTFGVTWIAYEDEPLERNREVIRGFISVALLADLFGVSVDKVAQDVLDVREHQVTRRFARAAAPYLRLYRYYD